MKLLGFLLLISLANQVFSEETGRLDREQLDYRYTYLGISFIGANNADNGLAINSSLKLPGPLYLKFERRADYKTYDDKQRLFDGVSMMSCSSLFIKI